MTSTYRKVLGGIVLAGFSLAIASFAQQSSSKSDPGDGSGPVGQQAASSQQQSAPDSQGEPGSQTTPEPAQPHGEVLFQSHGDAPASPQDNAGPAVPGSPGSPGNSASAPEKTAQPTGPAFTDAQRSAIIFTAYDLDARLTPASSGLSMRARLTVRNTSNEPLSRIALQISSTLHWESASLLPADAAGAVPIKLPLAQHLLDTDADHTGQANEALLSLPSPLVPGASISLDTFYAGTVTSNAGRLDRIGASPDQALGADWDAIAAGGSATSSPSPAVSSSDPATQRDFDAALRGFGNVLWYPVAEPQLFLGEGAELFQAIDQTRLREQNATIRLRIAIEYQGDPPAAVYFCGRRRRLVALPDNADAPVATGRGIASAEFSTEPIGFRLPSLFVVERPESLLAPLPGSVPSGSAPSGSTSLSGSTPAHGGPDSSGVSASAPPGTGDMAMLAVETTDDGALPRLADSAQNVAPLLQQWFGARPLSALTILDHDGQPFEDGPLLVAPLASLASSTAAGALAHSLTHAWVQTGEPWMDEGLAEFISLLWVEQQKGREAANAQLDQLVRPLSLAEPDFALTAAASSPPASSSSSSTSANVRAGNGSPGEPLGQPLIAASGAFYYRVKAAAVWWMLRDIAGDDPLRFALSAWRTRPVSHESPQVQAENFEKLLEKTSGKDLAWFFDDWVLRDRGLPDLTIVDVTPRELPAGKGHDTGWLVAVTVRNDGAAAAEVPVVIRSGTFSTTKRLRIGGFSSATDRTVVEAPPTEVLVNDGSVPEVRSSTHVISVTPKTE